MRKKASIQYLLQTDNLFHWTHRISFLYCMYMHRTTKSKHWKTTKSKWYLLCDTIIQLSLNCNKLKKKNNLYRCWKFAHWKQKLFSASGSTYYFATTLVILFILCIVTSKTNDSIKPCQLHTTEHSCTKKYTQSTTVCGNKLNSAGDTDDIHEEIIDWRSRFCVINRSNGTNYEKLLSRAAIYR